MPKSPRFEYVFFRFLCPFLNFFSRFFNTFACTFVKIEWEVYVFKTAVREDISKGVLFLFCM